MRYFTIFFHICLQNLECVLWVKHISIQRSLTWRVATALASLVASVLSLGCLPHSVALTGPMCVDAALTPYLSEFACLEE